MSEEQQLAEELEAILGRVSQIGKRLDHLLQEEREDKRVCWRTRLMVLLGITRSI